MVAKLAVVLLILYPPTAFDVGRATYAVCEDGKEGGDVDEDGDEPHPASATNPSAIKIRDVRFPGIIEALGEK
jgi:hypothetical protein